jgi:SAM-dependent methyltransferase
MRLPSELTRLKVFLRPFVARRYLREHAVRRLHIGCGDHLVPGWLNADKFDSRADIYLNVYGRLPFADDTFDAVYCEHVLEHVAIEKVRHFLAEVRRVLRPGGVFRVTVPDLEMFAARYVARDDGFFRPYIDMYQERAARGVRKTWIVRTNGAAFMTLANYRFFQHRWMYDFETIKACGEAVGYGRAVKQCFRQGLCAATAALDREFRRSETLYVDLVK